jgi:hypothetical protein
MGTFTGLLAAAGALGRLLDRDPQCQTPLDRGRSARPRSTTSCRLGSLL